MSAKSAYFRESGMEWLLTIGFAAAAKELCAWNATEPLASAFQAPVFYFDLIC